MTEVVAALIWEGSKFLACQRPAHKTRGLLWEFVGGKVEPGETKEQALIRECVEELGVTVAVGNIFMEVCHTYPDLTVNLTLFCASIACGVPQKLEHHDIRWITVDEIDDYEFCPADQEILVQLKQRCGGRTVLQQTLAAHVDVSYREFQRRLIPTVSAARILGVRTPFLRTFAKNLTKEEACEFLRQLPHRYYEEDILHGLLISSIQEYDVLIPALEKFLPYVDNWAVCDQLRPKISAVRRNDFLAWIKANLASEHPYVVRFAIEMLMVHYLDIDFSADHLRWVGEIQTKEYYVNMMIAWYFATALSRQYETVLAYLRENTLSIWVHNKTIQKALDSFRITPERKTVLRAMKRRS